ncbi:GGDEF domain-containing response regulator [Sulfuriferula thiophila]|uniref:GGDEF domain-containing response regulator n=1 Tax=Sulfuriferula thiophila TaxID=1781211 RepID=UPI000F60D9B1|nr:diguanylate cyclase [Sulfuriferula thiophila]
MNDQQLREKLRAIRANFAEQLPQRLAGLDAELVNLRAEGWSKAQLEVVHRLVHTLTGSGATFGFTALSDTARTLEVFLKLWLDNQHAPTAEQQCELSVLWEELQAAATIRDNDASEAELAGGGIFPGGVEATRVERKVLLVEDDNDLAAELTLQLGYYGYQVLHYSDSDDFLQRAPTEHVAAVVMDVMFPLGMAEGPDAISEYMRRTDKAVPVIFISSRDDLAARMQAVRAGGTDYLTKPLDMNELVDRLDTLTLVTPSDPYRILIIEDSPPLADFYGHILHAAGMETLVLHEPSRMLENLSDFNPDLILMDMYLPDYRGDELAKVIRQQHRYVSVPIVYLSSETDIKRQLDALRFGGDDFLTKPMNPEHLVSAVTHRAQRYRVLRGLLESDSLTGLLNHTKVKQRLEIELANARRHRHPLSFVMLDIDNFKEVNDNYGHPVGDRVIKSLSRMLKQRLRETDIIGRYGGEEFAIIFTHTDGVAASKVMEGLRRVFEEIQQQYGDAVFHVTFSCGIATFPDISSAAELGARADQALYEAKHAGRNRVVLK